MDKIIRKNSGKLIIRNKKYFVYSLINCNTKEIVYIGYTSDEKNRYRDHLKSWNSRVETKLKNYLNMCKNNSILIEYKNIKEFNNKENALSMERKLIKHYKPFIFCCF